MKVTIGSYVLMHGGNPQLVSPQCPTAHEFHRRCCISSSVDLLLFLRGAPTFFWTIFRDTVNSSERKASMLFHTAGVSQLTSASKRAISRLFLHYCWSTWYPWPCGRMSTFHVKGESSHTFAVCSVSKPVALRNVDWVELVQEFSSWAGIIPFKRRISSRRLRVADKDVHRAFFHQCETRSSLMSRLTLKLRVLQPFARFFNTSGRRKHPLIVTSSRRTSLAVSWAPLLKSFETMSGEAVSSSNTDSPASDLKRS